MQHVQLVVVRAAKNLSDAMSNALIKHVVAKADANKLDVVAEAALSDKRI